MKTSIKIGLGFGITSGVITTLGLMIGLYESTNSRLAILGGIITIAIADAFSDALGIHISEESVEKSQKKIWKSTFSTFFSKFFTASIFIIPIFLFQLRYAIMFNVISGILILGIFSFLIAKSKKEKPIVVIAEHLGIAIGVIVVTYIIGKLVGIWFG